MQNRKVHFQGRPGKFFGKNNYFGLCGMAGQTTVSIEKVSCKTCLKFLLSKQLEKNFGK
jgi:hypothetical protein